LFGFMKVNSVAGLLDACARIGGDETVVNPIVDPPYVGHGPGSANELPPQVYRYRERL
jgi:hypothetical protein